MACTVCGIRKNCVHRQLQKYLFQLSLMPSANTQADNIAWTDVRQRTDCLLGKNYGLAGNVRSVAQKQRISRSSGHCFGLDRVVRSGIAQKNTACQDASLRNNKGNAFKRAHPFQICRRLGSWLP